MHLCAGQVFQAIFALYWIVCRADTKSSPLYVTFHIRDPVRVAQHCSVTEIPGAEITVAMCELKSYPVWFGAGTTAIL